METTKTKPRSTLNKFFGYFMWLSLLIISFVAGRSCENRSLDKRYTKAWADSIQAESKTEVKAWQDKYEQSRRDGERADEVIKNLDAEKYYYQDKMQAAEKTAEHWHTKFKQAKELRDTVTMISACDSALPRFMEALDYTQKRHGVDSLIIDTLKGQLVVERDLKEFANSTIKSQAIKIDTLAKAVTILNKEKKKRKFWRWVERIGIAAGTAFVFTR